MRRVNSTASMSGEIEQVVTKLLRTTKALLEALTQWSLMRTPSNEIYEIHDTLEKQFFLVSQAFEDANVTMSDLQWIPRQLRESVSTAMSEPPSPVVLDQHLPRIREVIVHLLQGLKGKQALLREKERESRASVRSNNSGESWNREVPLAALNRGNSSRMMMYPVQPSSPPLPPHPPHSPRSDYEPWSGGMPRPSIPTNDLSSRIMPRASTSTTSRPYSPPQPQTSPRLQHQQTSPRLQHQQTSPLLQHQQIPSRSNSYRVSNMPPQQMPVPPPPPPPPVTAMPAVAPPQQSFDENDPSTASALAALKRQENLARRSSVRRASMFRAGGEYTGGSISRGKGQHLFNDPPPMPTLPITNADFSVSSPVPSKLNTVTESKDANEHEEEKKEEEEEKVLTLFLQIGKQVQKVKYSGEISIPALNMLFLEKFSYSLGQNDFPKIYIRDPTVGVSYELTDLSEVRNNSVLSFNVDEEKEGQSQKEWVTEATAAFRKELSETHRLFMEQIEDIKKQMSHSEERFVQQLTTHLQSQAPVKVEASPETNRVSTPSISDEQFESQRLEIEALRRDIAVLRQLEREMRDETAQVIADIKQKAETYKSEESKKTEGQIAVARASLEDGKKTLIEKSEKITNRLEELQDTIDQLKLDVTQRKCRPSEAQMTHCADERKALAEDIEEFGKFIAQVKPRWKKTWEHELQTIVKEQQTLKDQEYLLSDMKDDLDALLEVYEQLAKICAYQANARPQVREFRVAPAEEGFEGMSSVLKQVSSIDVDHDRRVRAMEQAEKMRQRELANRIDDFEKELVGFVENKKLKKTGGALEIERIRKQKDEEIRKALYAEKQASSGTSTPLTED